MESEKSQEPNNEKVDNVVDLENLESFDIKNNQIDLRETDAPEKNKPQIKQSPEIIEKETDTLEELPKKEEVPTPAITKNQENVKIKEPNVILAPLRTYDDDVKNAIESNNVSTSSIYMAEQRKREQEEKVEEQTSPTSKTNLTKIFLSLIFILGGLGAIFYIIFIIKPFTQTTQEIPVVEITPNNFLDRETLITITNENTTTRNIIGEIRKQLVQNLASNTIKEITFGKSISFVEFLSYLDSRVPNALIRALDSNFMLGVAKKDNVQAPFIIVEIIDLKQAYSEMLSWERFLVDDIKNIFYQKLGSSDVFGDEIQNLQEVSLETASSTASTTPMATSTNSTTTNTVSENTEKKPLYDSRKFVDLIINNQDTRAIKSEDTDEVLFFYSLVNKKYLVMTSDVAIFEMLINRINSSSLIR